MYAVLKNLLQGVDVVSTTGSIEVNITSVCADSHEVNKNNDSSDGGALFAAMKVLYDGHDFISSAISNGAIAIVLDNKEFLHTLPSQITGILVRDSAKALAQISAAFHSYPAQHLKVAGITGTNGKTTTTMLVKHICQHAGVKCGTIGTLGYQVGDTVYKGKYTTPHSSTVQLMLRRMVDNDHGVVAMETSSQAIIERHVDDVDFDVVVFTNLSQDHLNVHKTMEEYFLAKAQLFTRLLEEQGERKRKKMALAVVNADDEYGQRLTKLVSEGVRVVSFGFEEGVDYRASDASLYEKGTSFKITTVEGTSSVLLPLFGKYNIYNALAAIAITTIFDIPIEKATEALESIEPVPGRLQLVPSNTGIKVFVDYAHTPDALKNVLLNVRDILASSSPASSSSSTSTSSRIIIVFGCGGNRDKQKRPQMAHAAIQYADYVIVTTDNPRDEEPTAIIDDIVAGVAVDGDIEEADGGNGKRFEVEVDRRAAIKKAIFMAKEGDIVLIAGKGHEKTMTLEKGRVVDFNDMEIAAEYLRKLR